MLILFKKLFNKPEEKKVEPPFDYSTLPIGEVLSDNAKNLLFFEENGTEYIDAQEMRDKYTEYDAETWSELVNKGYLEEINVSLYKICKWYI